MFIKKIEKRQIENFKFLEKQRLNTLKYNFEHIMIINYSY